MALALVWLVYSANSARRLGYVRRHAEALRRSLADAEQNEQAYLDKIAATRADGGFPESLSNSKKTALPLADGEGFDTTAISQGKPGCDKEGEAKAEAFFENLPLDLAAIVAAWDKLPDAAKAGIMAMVHAVAPTESKPKRRKANRKKPKRSK